MAREMEFNEDRTQCRQVGWGYEWEEIDPETGLVKLDEGLYWHFRKRPTGIEVSVRLRTWFGYRTLFTTEVVTSVQGVDDLLSLSYAARSRLSHSGAYRAWLAARATKETLVNAEKWMGSYKPGKKVQNDND